MNIVVAADYAYVNGGAGRIALDSAKGLAGRGHQVTLFTGVGALADDLRDVPRLRHVSLDQQDVWQNANRLRAAAQGIWNPAAARGLDRVLSRLEPRDTVVHLHSWSKALSSSVVRLASSRGFRMVLTLHDFLSVCPNGSMFNHQTESCCELRPLSRQCVTTHCDANSYAQKLWRVARHTVQGSLGGLPGAVRDFITVSHASARILQPLLPDGARLHHVGNFTDVPKEPPAAVDRNAAFVYVGRLSPEKGPLLLADCLRRLNLPAIFVGDGELADDVRARHPRAELTGWLATAQVRETMRRARALAFPSLWYETQGLVVAEAAAVGVPSIVPDTSAARDWVIDGTTGLWFSGGDADSLSSALARLADDPALAARLGQEAYRRFWAAPPTLERHLEELEQVYSLLLEPVRSRVQPRRDPSPLESTC